MKTPHQIACNTVIDQYGFPASMSAKKALDKVLDARDCQTPHDLLDVIAKAIEADRAQRKRADEIMCNLLMEATICIGGVLAAEQDGLITLSDHDKRLLTRAREHTATVYADLNNEDDK